MAELLASSIFNIKGWNTVITGGGGGLGKVLGKAFLVNGSSVTLIDVSQDRLEQTKKEFLALKSELGLEGSITTITGDVGSREGIDAVLFRVGDQSYRTIDTLIMAAGIRKTNLKSFTPGQSLQDLVAATRSLDWDDFEKSFRVNVYAQYYLTAGLLDLIGASAQQQPGRGSVICFSSVAGQHTAQFVPAYQTSKAAVNHLVRIMAAEFADHYIRVNAISPGLFPSNMNPVDPSHPGSNMRFAKETPARRPGTEQEIAAAAIFLASPGGFYITGQNICPDGGRLLVAAGKIHVATD